MACARPKDLLSQPRGRIPDVDSGPRFCRRDPSAGARVWRVKRFASRHLPQEVTAWHCTQTQIQSFCRFLTKRRRHPGRFGTEACQGRDRGCARRYLRGHPRHLPRAPRCGSMSGRGAPPHLVVVPVAGPTRSRMPSWRSLRGPAVHLQRVRRVHTREIPPRRALTNRSKRTLRCINGTHVASVRRALTTICSGFTLLIR